MYWMLEIFLFNGLWKINKTLNSFEDKILATFCCFFLKNAYIKNSSVKDIKIILIPTEVIKINLQI